MWLDATDVSTITYNPYGYDVTQWRDKSSNAFTFAPLRGADRPFLSTNSINFNQVSSFQLISQQTIPALSTLDFFCVVTPNSLLGPRQPFFDSADITVSETDNRFNTQVYADGNEIFRQVPTLNNGRGGTIYRGDLFIGTDVLQVPNYLQRYNSNTRAFEYWNPPVNAAFIRSLSVYDGKLHVACSTFTMWYNGSTAFISTTVLSTNTSIGGSYGPVVYNRELYAYSFGSIDSRSNVNTRPQLFKYIPASNIYTAVASLQVGIATNASYFMYPQGAIPYKGDLYLYGTGDNNSNFVTRWNGQFYNSNVLAASYTPTYTSAVFNGSLLLGRNDQRLFKWNNNAYQNFGRLQFGQPSGGMVAYKGNLWVMKNFNQGGSNTVEIFSGETGGPFSNAVFSQVTANTTNINVGNGMIVHDGKLFLNANNNTFWYEYGNGTTLDMSISTFTSAPILLQIRKTPTITQMYVNGNLLESIPVNFTYSNQTPRYMYVGGAAGTLNGTWYGDLGSDHLEGAIHSIVEYNGTLNTGDRQLVEGILAWQFGIQTVLPADHPYRNTPPPS
jgi:hypothetical protein